MRQMGFFFDQTRCTGCYTCQVACKDWHDVDAGPASWMRVRVVEEGRFPNPFLAYLAVPCFHCAEPPCVQVCPVGAIAKREADGVVVVDRGRCAGSAECPTLCRTACPWDAPQFAPDPGAKMEKCDLCLERLETGRQTVCVEACPMYALDVGPIEELRERHGRVAEAAGFRRALRADPSVTFKPKTRHSGPSAG